jgi:hypothetical protein|nr:MAG TPA: hypothetical protein [Caudoviricetes sp.]
MMQQKYINDLYQEWFDHHVKEVYRHYEENVVAPAEKELLRCFREIHIAFKAEIDDPLRHRYFRGFKVTDTKPSIKGTYHAGNISIGPHPTLAIKIDNDHTTIVFYECEAKRNNFVGIERFLDNDRIVYALRYFNDNFCIEKYNITTLMSLGIDLIGEAIYALYEIFDKINCGLVTFKTPINLIRDRILIGEDKDDVKKHLRTLYPFVDPMVYEDLCNLYWDSASFIRDLLDSRDSSNDYYNFRSPYDHATCINKNALKVREDFYRLDYGDRIYEVDLTNRTFKVSKGPEYRGYDVDDLVPTVLYILSPEQTSDIDCIEVLKRIRHYLKTALLRVETLTLITSP